MLDSSQRTEIAAYLDLIYPPEHTYRGLISVSHSTATGTGFPSAHFPRGQANEGVADWVERELLGGRPPGFYLRCSTVSADVGQGRRGNASQCEELPGLWSDIDIAGPGHKHDPSKYEGRQLPGDVAAAMSIITAAGLPQPTAVVHSGGGLYAWWLFSQPVRLDAGARSHWSLISETWQARLAAGAASLELHYGTGVGNLDRVLGLVGTDNAKTEVARRRVLLQAPGGGRYSSGELADWLLSSAAAVSTPAVGAASGAGTGLVERLESQFQLPSATRGSASGVENGGYVSPLDDFESRHDWAEILGGKGWTQVSGGGPGEYREWRHPDATHPLSATTGKDPARDRLWNFSDSCGLPVGESLTKGFVFAALYHGGDMRKAAQAVAGMGYGSALARANGASAEVGEQRRIELTPASAVKMRATRWLWQEGKEEWLPLGALCLLGGREGTGKTTWTYRLISALSRGELPGDLFGQPKSSVIAATEDDWECTILPRLVAAGADLDRVFRVEAVEPDRRTGVILPDDLERLSAALGQRDDVALMVLDPIVSVIPARADSHKDHEVRRSLEPIQTMAFAFGITILGLIHDNKSTGQDLSTRLMGSRAFVAVARAALVCAAEEAEDEPEDDEEGPGAGGSGAGRARMVDEVGADPVPRVDGFETPSDLIDPAAPVFMIGQVKSNLGAKVSSSIRYRIGAKTVGHDDAVDKDIRGSFIQRVGRRLERLEDTVRGQEQPLRRKGGTGKAAPLREEAMDFIVSHLREHGPAASVTVKRAAVAAGFSEGTVKAAARILLGDVMIGSGPDTQRVWSLASSSPVGRESIQTIHSIQDIQSIQSIQKTESKVEETQSNSLDSVDSVVTLESDGEVVYPDRHASPPSTLRVTCHCVDGQHVPWCSVAKGKSAK